MSLRGTQHWGAPRRPDLHVQAVKCHQVSPLHLSPLSSPTSHLCQRRGLSRNLVAQAGMCFCSPAFYLALWLAQGSCWHPRLLWHSPG